MGFASEKKLVLVGYPLHDPRDTEAMAEAVSEALKIRDLRISPSSDRPDRPRPGRRARLPRTAIIPCRCRILYLLQKVRNLIRRASRELTVERGHQWGDDHLALVQRYLDERHLEPGTRHVFQHLPHYLAASPGSLVLSGRLADGKLAAFVVGDFSAFRTAFFMFCFRDPRLAPPGSTDLLLGGLLEEAYQRGQTLMNLGLGINTGVGFFKRKWGALPFLPYVEVSWAPARPGLLQRLSSIFGR